MMATLIVFKFNNADGAERALETLKLLQQQQPISLGDAAVVVWPKGKNRPSTRQATPTASIDRLDATFWGMLFGLIFFMPVLGIKTAGGLSGALMDVGIEDTFIYQLRSKITEGTSALFAFSPDIAVDRIVDAYEGTTLELMATKLSKEQEARLRDLFGHPVMPNANVQI
jgi:uncharacterized membrane protein